MFRGVLFPPLHSLPVFFLLLRLANSERGALVTSHSLGVRSGVINVRLK